MTCTTRIHRSILIVISSILMGFSILVGFSMSVYADPVTCLCENKYDRYLIIPDLYNEITSRRQTELPYTMLDAMYFDGKWQLPNDFDRALTIKYAKVIDFQTGEVHFIYINQGRWFVHVWGSFEIDIEGNPHPIAAYWIRSLGE